MALPFQPERSQIDDVVIGAVRRARLAVTAAEPGQMLTLGLDVLGPGQERQIGQARGGLQGNGRPGVHFVVKLLPQWMAFGQLHWPCLGLSSLHLLHLGLHLDNGHRRYDRVGDTPRFLMHHKDLTPIGWPRPQTDHGLSGIRCDDAFADDHIAVEEAFARRDDQKRHLRVLVKRVPLHQGQAHPGIDGGDLASNEVVSGGAL